MEIRITPFAGKNLEDMHEYLSEFNPSAADKIINNLFEHFDFLAQFPYAGAPRDDIGSGFRCKPSGNRLIIYSIEDDIVAIRAVLGPGQSLKRLLAK